MPNSASSQHASGGQAGLKKFFGIAKPSGGDIKMGFTDEQCSQQSATEGEYMEEEKRQGANNSGSQKSLGNKLQSGATAYRPQFRLKSQHSQKTFSSQCSAASQYSISGDESMQKQPLTTTTLTHNER